MTWQVSSILTWVIWGITIDSWNKVSQSQLHLENVVVISTDKKNLPPSGIKLDFS